MLRTHTFTASCSESPSRKKAAAKSKRRWLISANAFFCAATRHRSMEKSLARNRVILPWSGCPIARRHKERTVFSRRIAR